MDDSDTLSRYTSRFNIYRHGYEYMAIAAHLDSYWIVKWLWERIPSRHRKKYLPEWVCLAARTTNHSDPTITTLIFLCKQFGTSNPSRECVRKIFWCAIIGGKESSVDFVFSRYGHIIQITEGDFFTAVCHGHLEVAEWMICRGVTLATIESAIYMLAHRRDVTEKMLKFLKSYLRKGAAHLG